MAHLKGPLKKEMSLVKIGMALTLMGQQVTNFRHNGFRRSTLLFIRRIQ
ncbi:MAG: hypothetical protein IEMM0008_1318 [bacterium]|nr:MAG: hypothetical protein IEMM0008_1318 [bacterium]